MGNPFGRANDNVMQRKILMDSLDHAVNAQKAGELIQAPYDWGEKILTIFDLKDAWKSQAPDPATGKQPT